MSDETRTNKAYFDAVRSVDFNNPDSISKLKSAADDGNPYAQNEYGKFLFNSEEPNYPEALSYFLMASEQGIDESEFYMGLAYLNGLGTEKDGQAAFKMFMISAEKGFAPAQHYFGLCYKEGISTYADQRIAIRWFKRAADKGHSESYIELGDIYSDLHNPERDYKMAASFYLQAVEANVKGSHYKMGMCYHKGLGVRSIDDTKAAKYFETGIETGDWECEFVLGTMYLKGTGVPRDRGKGMKLISEAASMGSENAKKFLKHETDIISVDTPDEYEIVRLNTPDIIPKYKGAKKRSLLGLIKR